MANSSTNLSCKTISPFSFAGLEKLPESIADNIFGSDDIVAIVVSKITPPTLNFTVENKKHFTIFNYDPRVAMATKLSRVPKTVT